MESPSPSPSPSPSLTSSTARVLILYGTQTGNAESIARSLHSVLIDWLPHADCSSMANYLSSHGDSLSDLPSHHYLLFVLSTTGQGDPPDSASRFLRLLRKHLNSASPFFNRANNAFAVLALGDTNYTDFCAPGIRLDGEMERLGARRLVSKALADDATGLQATVDPWKANIQIKLKEEIQTPSDSKDPSAAECSVDTLKRSAIAALEANQFAAARDLIIQILNSSQTKTTNQQASTAAAVSGSSAAHSLPSDSSISSVDSSLISKPRVKVEKPPGLARLPALKCSVLWSGRTSSDFNSYFVSRWHHLKSEADETLRGYTHETPFMAKLIGGRYLTSEKSHGQGRSVIHLELQLPLQAADAVIYEPGDAIGVYAPNQLSLVEALCNRLQINPHAEFTLESVGDDPASSSSASPLAHIRTPCTVQDAFLYCCDLSSIPRKTFFRLLAEHSNDPREKANLYHLASVGGAAEFEREIVRERLNLLEILLKFPSTNPPLAALLGELPELKPRYYSVSCSPLLYPTSVQIAFTVVNYETPLQRHRQGLASSWLMKLAEESGFLESTAARVGSIRRHQSIKALGIPVSFDPASTADQSALDASLRKLSGFLTQSFAREPMISNYKYIRDYLTPNRSNIAWKSEEELLALMSRGNRWPNLRIGEPLFGVRRNQAGDYLLPVFVKRSKQFALPVDLKQPMILIGPGTGVAPFRGFLQHRMMELNSIKAGDCSALGWWRCVEVQLEEAKSHRDQFSTAPNGSAPGLGQIWLFFGCRSRSEDYLYQEDFQRFSQEGVLTKLCEAFSREQEEKIYVQHKIKENAKQIADLIVNQQAIVYVCGDGAVMARQVAEEIETTLANSGMGAAEAKKLFFDLIRQKRFIQDIWS